MGLRPGAEDVRPRVRRLSHAGENRRSPGSAPTGRRVHLRGLLKRAGHERAEHFRRKPQCRFAQVALQFAEIPRRTARVRLGLDGGADEFQNLRLNLT